MGGHGYAGILPETLPDLGRPSADQKRGLLSLQSFEFTNTIPHSYSSTCSTANLAGFPKNLPTGVQRRKTFSC